MKKYAQKREGSGEPLNWGNRRFPRFGRKGFVLTFDAATAATVAVIMGVAIVGILSSKTTDMRIAYSIAGDLLSSMDKESANYTGYSGAEIQQSMQTALQVLPKNFCGNMTVRIYDANDFNKNSAYEASSCQTGNESSKAGRIFADYNREKFGIIELSIRMR